MKVSANVNQTVCDQLLSLFLNKGANETVQCVSGDGEKTPNEVLYIIGLLLAPIFACLTVAMFLLMVFVASQVSESCSKLVSRFQATKKATEPRPKYGVKPIWTGDIVDESIERNGEITSNILADMPKKPPRYKTSGN